MSGAQRELLQRGAQLPAGCCKLRRQRAPEGHPALPSHPPAGVEVAQLGRAQQAHRVGLQRLAPLHQHGQVGPHLRAGRQRGRGIAALRSALLAGRSQVGWRPAWHISPGGHCCADHWRRCTREAQAVRRTWASAQLRDTSCVPSSSSRRRSLGCTTSRKLERKCQAWAGTPRPAAGGPRGQAGAGAW